MSRYLVTISWQDEVQPLIRCKTTDAVSISDIEDKPAYQILQEIKDELGREFRSRDIVIDFMMKIN